MLWKQEDRRHRIASIDHEAYDNADAQLSVDLMASGRVFLTSAVSALETYDWMNARTAVAVRECGHLLARRRGEWFVVSFGR